MEDFERYGDYTEFDEDIPQNKSAFILTLKILVAVVCFGVIGLILFRLLMFNYYPSSMKMVYFNDTLTAYYEQTGGEIGAKTQKLSAPYDDPDVASFFCGNLIVISGADQLQLSVRYNLALVDDLKEKYGVDVDPTDPHSFTYRLVRNPISADGEPLEIGRLDYAYTEEGMMYSYTKLVFDGVDFELDSVNSAKWIRLEIDIAGVTLDEPYAIICVYENNDRYAIFSDYDLSKEEAPR